MEEKWSYEKLLREYNDEADKSDDPNYPHSLYTIEWDHCLTDDQKKQRDELANKNKNPVIYDYDDAIMLY
jgi:lipoate-protein ligase B